MVELEAKPVDSITEMIKKEIRAQYKSVRKFSEASGIPYSTLSNALTKGIGGTSFDTVTKIFSLLHIKHSSEDGIVLFNEEFQDFYTKLTQLDEQGVNTVCAVLNSEYVRCNSDQKDSALKAFNGFGYVSAPVEAFDSEKIKRLVKKVQQNGR
jgi:DNA-binding transcriptional ArsR family regulator